MGATRWMTLWRAVAIAIVVPACFASAGSVRTLEQRMGVVENRDEERRRQLSQAVERASQEVRTLTQQLEQARAQTRNLADLGVRLDGLDEQLRTVNGGLAELRRAVETSGTDVASLRSTLVAQVAAIERRVLEVERRTGLAAAVDPNQIPQNPADIMTQARAALTARDYVRTRALAAALLQRAPQDALADDARLLIGRSFAQEGRNATAVQEYQRVLTDFPTGDAVPDALTELSDALVRLGMCEPAQRTLRILIDRHGSTPQGQAARRRLEDVRRLPRQACTG